MSRKDGIMENTKNFEIWEDNAGCLTFIAKDSRNKLLYIHTYWGDVQGQLYVDLMEYLQGNFPVDYWDGNELEDLAYQAGSLDALMAEYQERPGQITQIVGPGWIAPERMGESGRCEFFGIVQ